MLRPPRPPGVPSRAADAASCVRALAAFRPDLRMKHLELLLLGSPRVRVDARAARLTLRKALALLVFLVCNGGRHRRDALAELLWPGSQPGTGRTRLRRTAHRLADAIGFNPLEGDAETLGLAGDTAIDCDALRFEQSARSAAAGSIPLERIRAIADLYGGDFMQGFALPDNDDFMRWRDAWAHRLRSLQLDLLRLLIERCRAAGDHETALLSARRLVFFEPAEESSHRLLIELLIADGRTGEALAQYAACRQMLREDYGAEPSAATRALVGKLEAGLDHTAPAPIPRIHYTASADAHIAYQVVGRGRPDVLLVPGFVSHLEQCWLEPALAGFLGRLAADHRLILLDRRGIGLSDRTAGPPTAESTAADLEAVLDAAGAERAILFGISEGGPAVLRFARNHPGRVHALVLFGTMARGAYADDYPWALDRAGFDAWLDRMIANWGGPAGIRMFAPSRADDPALRDWWARTLRLGSSPGAMRAVLEALHELDVRELLAEIDVPTLVMHREGDRAIHVEAGRRIARALPDSVWVRLSGADHWPWIGETEPVLGAFRTFVSGLA